MNATIAKVAEYIVYCFLLLLIINIIALRRAWRRLYEEILRTAVLHEFEIADKQSGISIFGLAHKLFFICPCGSQIEFKGRREKCPMCRSRLEFTPGLRRLTRQMTKGIGTLTMPEIDQLISTSNQPESSSTA